jgi:outer membrane protein insertion porin family
VAAGARRHLAAGLTLVLALVAWGGSIARGQTPQAPIIIKELAVEGNRRVQEAVILGRVKSALGSPFNPAQLSDDIRAIFGLGFFDDVQAKVTDFEGGVRLTFVVKERPFVRDMAFVGNKVFSVATLQEKVDVKLGSVYNPVEVQRSVDTLKTYYEEDGYLEATITPEVERFGDGDVKIVFNIVEGRRITINRIVIVGNKGLPAKQIREAMTTQEREFFILRGKVQRQKLDEDVERILTLYNDHGYIQARVESTDIAVDRERADATITIAVVEGPQFRAGEIKITGVTLLPLNEIERQYVLKPGDVFSRTKLRETVQAITDLYSTIGRASVEVVPRTENIASPPTVNITYEITEGPEVYVERINIAGNTRSEDKILRREIPMAEGDLFTLKKLNTARQRLVNLGYFETVNATTQPGSDPAKIIVNFEVTEKPSGVFSIGGGYSSADSFVGTIDLAQNNFLGRGYQAAIRIRAGELTQQGVISFTDPWLFDMPLAGGFDLFSLQRDYTGYTYNSLGGTARLSKPFEEFWRVTGSYRLSRDEISDINEAATPELKDQDGTTITSMVSFGLARDSRDSTTVPSKGGQFLISSDFAGLGGDNRFFKMVASLSRFQPIWFGHIVAARVEGGYLAGWGGEESPLFERFFLGGPNSLRGWEFRQISPVDQNGQQTGGTSQVLANVEYLIPLPFNLRLALFMDVGNVYGFGNLNSQNATFPEMKGDVGAGIRWISPFGPIRVDYGIKVFGMKSGDDLGAIQFSVGSPF